MATKTYTTEINSYMPEHIKEAIKNTKIKLKKCINSQSYKTNNEDRNLTINAWWTFMILLIVNLQ